MSCSIDDQTNGNDRLATNIDKDFGPTLPAAALHTSVASLFQVAFKHLSLLMNISGLDLVVPKL
jgi:hypothetical protein